MFWINNSHQRSQDNSVLVLIGVSSYLTALPVSQ